MVEVECRHACAHFPHLVSEQAQLLGRRYCHSDAHVGLQWILGVLALIPQAAYESHILLLVHQIVLHEVVLIAHANVQHMLVHVVE